MVERQHDRVTVPMPVLLACTSGRREVRISDLSVGGCYVDTIASVRPEEIVSFTLFPPDGRTHEIDGTVVYVHDGIGFGVKFHDLTPDQLQILKQLVLSNGGTA